MAERGAGEEPALAALEPCRRRLGRAAGPGDRRAVGAKDRQGGVERLVFAAKRLPRRREQLARGGGILVGGIADQRGIEDRVAGLAQPLCDPLELPPNVGLDARARRGFIGAEPRALQDPSARYHGERAGRADQSDPQQRQPGYRHVRSVGGGNAHLDIVEARLVVGGWWLVVAG